MRAPPNDERTDSSAAALRYGGRFFDELRGITNSSWGFSYAQIEQIRAMGRDDVLSLFRRRPGAEWILDLDSSSPEQFAQAIVREGQRRAAGGDWDFPEPLDILFDLAQFLPH